MDINHFAETTGLPVKSIRFYMELGLIRPKKKNTFWVFDTTCVADARRLRRYKAAGLSMQAIGQLFALGRNTALDKAARQAAMLQILQAAAAAHQQEKRELALALRKTKEALRVQRGSMATSFGNSIPLALMALVYCPHCNLPLQWENVRIAGGRVLEGDGYCYCSFRAVIERGILIAQPEAVPEIRALDSNRDTIKRLASRTVGFYEKYHRWMMHILGKIDLKQKVIFEDVINVACFLGIFIHELDSEACFILSDTDIRVVQYYMESTTAVNPMLNTLFIVDDGVNHPLKKGCLDVVIDRASSDILQRHSYPSLAYALRNYVHSGTDILGTFSHITKSRRPGKSAIPSIQYPYSYRYNMDAFLASLQENNVKLVETRDDASNVDKSAYDGVTDEDVLAIFAYWGKFS